MIESIAILLLDNGTFGIDCQDLFSSWVNTSKSDFDETKFGGRDLPPTGLQKH